jgi:hypothetical protein
LDLVCALTTSPSLEQRLSVCLVSQWICQNHGDPL